MRAPIKATRRKRAGAEGSAARRRRPTEGAKRRTTFRGGRAWASCGGRPRSLGPHARGRAPRGLRIIAPTTWGGAGGWRGGWERVKESRTAFTTIVIVNSLVLLSVLAVLPPTPLASASARGGARLAEASAGRPDGEARPGMSHRSRTLLPHCIACTSSLRVTRCSTELGVVRVTRCIGPPACRGRQVLGVVRVTRCIGPIWSSAVFVTRVSFT